MAKELTGQTFQTLYAEMSLLWPDKQEWFKEMLAALGDEFFLYLDARFQDSHLSTAYTGEAIAAWADRLDFRAPGPSAARGILEVTTTAATFPATIPAGDLVFYINIPGGSRIRVEALEDLNLTSPVGTALFEASEMHSAAIGDLLEVNPPLDSTVWREYLLPHADILHGTITNVVLDGQSWTLPPSPREKTLTGSWSSARHFLIVPKPDNKTALLTGNNVTGMAGVAGQCTADYRTGGGSSGNAKAGTTTYVGNNSQVLSAVIVGYFTGGSSGLTSLDIKTLAPKSLRNNYRLVSESDYESVGRSLFPWLLRAKAFPGWYGSGSIRVQVIGAGGGSLNPSFLEEYKNYCVGHGPPSNRDVTVTDPYYSPQNMTAGLKPISGIAYSSLEPFGYLVMRLWTSETAHEVLQEYLAATRSGSFDSLLEMLLNYWGLTFTAVNIPELKRLLAAKQADVEIKYPGAVLPLWGADLHPNDVIAALDRITGVDFVELTEPSVFIQKPASEMTISGTLTLTEIVT